MTKATVEMTVFVTVEVPDHILKRDRDEGNLTESEIWHDYAVGAIHQSVSVLHGKDKNEDWVDLYAEVDQCEIYEEPVHEDDD